MIDRKQIAIDFVKSLNHPEIEKIILFGLYKIKIRKMIKFPKI